MILVIDNYDSCTYHLVQYLGELGAGLPIAREIEVARNDRITIEEIERLAPKRIVLSPGPCTPDDAGITLRVPRPGLCTDNGAMVASLGAQMVLKGRTPSDLDLPADSSMPVTEVQS